MAKQKRVFYSGKRDKKKWAQGYIFWSYLFAAAVAAIAIAGISKPASAPTKTITNPALPAIKAPSTLAELDSIGKTRALPGLENCPLRTEGKQPGPETTFLLPHNISASFTAGKALAATDSVIWYTAGLKPDRKCLRALSQNVAGLILWVPTPVTGYFENYGGQYFLQRGTMPLPPLPAQATAGLSALALAHAESKNNKITIGFSESLSAEELYTLSRKISDIPPKATGYPVTQNRSLKTWSQWVLIVLLIILQWLPLINVASLKKQRIQLVSGCISSLYFGLIPAFYAGLINLAKGFHFSLDTAIIASLVLVVPLYLYAKRLESRVVNVSTNPVSAMLVFNAMLTLVAFINPIVFGLLIPGALLFFRFAQHHAIVKLFGFALGIMPAAAVIVLAYPYYGVTNAVALFDITRYSWQTITMLILIFGSIFAMFNRKQNEN